MKKNGYKEHILQQKLDTGKKLSKSELARHIQITKQKLMPAASGAKTNTN